jgi:chromosome segregation ATPase
MFRRAKGELTSKFKLGGSEVQFVAADTSLDLMAQARVNLNSFKSYLEHDSDDSHGHYSVVAQTMSRACSQFTNRTAELEILIDQARTAASDIVEQENSILAQKATFCEKLLDVEAEDIRLRGELEKLRLSAVELESQIEAGSDQIEKVEEARVEYGNWTERQRELMEEFEREAARTKELLQEEEELKEALRRRSEGEDEEVVLAEARVRELASKVKELVVREEQAAKKVEEEAPAAQVELPAFVIEDSVHVNGEEIKNLVFMVAALREENELLAGEVESRMVDIGCLGQENMGLKQIIREMVEGV